MNIKIVLFLILIFGFVHPSRLDAQVGFYISPGVKFGWHEKSVSLTPKISFGITPDNFDDYGGIPYLNLTLAYKISGSHEKFHNIKYWQIQGGWVPIGVGYGLGSAHTKSGRQRVTITTVSAGLFVFAEVDIIEHADGTRTHDFGVLAAVPAPVWGYDRRMLGFD